MKSFRIKFFAIICIFNVAILFVMLILPYKSLININTQLLLVVLLVLAVITGNCFRRIAVVAVFPLILSLVVIQTINQRLRILSSANSAVVTDKHLSGGRNTPCISLDGGITLNGISRDLYNSVDVGDTLHRISFLEYESKGKIITILEAHFIDLFRKQEF